jgi:predicted RNase H-like nuclease (RuvC/YqgF family)
MREAQAQLESLLMQYSRSPHAAEAKFIIGLLHEIRNLRTGLRARDDSIAALQVELNRSRKRGDTGESRRADALQQELEKLRAEAREKDERIKRLADELDRLKKIDMERRKPRAP